MEIKELYVLDDIYENIKVINCENEKDLSKMIEDTKVIKFIWRGKNININCSYIVSYII